MQVKIYARGLGYGIKGATLLTVFALGRIYLKRYSSDNEVVLRLKDDACIGDKTSATLFVELETEWFEFDAPGDSWMHNTTELLHSGTTMEIEFSNGEIKTINEGGPSTPIRKRIKGASDVHIRKIDKYNKVVELLGKAQIKTNGTLFAPILIRAKVEMDPKDLRRKYRYKHKGLYR